MNFATIKFYTANYTCYTANSIAISTYHNHKEIKYGKFSYQTTSTWNDLQNKLGINMLEESNSKIKTAF